MISRIKFVSIPVKDYDRALKFYTQKLKFELISDHKFNDGSRWIELKIGNSETRLVLFNPPGEGIRTGSLMNLAFTSADVDDAYREMKKLGAEFKVPPTTAPWGTYAQFIDSEENIIVLSSR